MQDRDVYVIDGVGLEVPEQAPADKNTQRQRRRPDTAAVAHGGGRPRLAASCSMLLSGSGQLLHGRRKAGLVYLLVASITLALHYFLPVSWAGLRAWASHYDLVESDLLVGLLLVDLFLILVLLSGVFDAFRVGMAFTGGHHDPAPHPLGPAFASMLVPGWGQIVNRQIGKALAFLFVVYALIFAAAAWFVLPGPIEQVIRAGTNPLPPALIVFALAMVGIVVWALSLYDAALVARYRRV